MAAKKQAQTFESALERIEQIAIRMEAGDLPLEQLVAIYEEGLGLIRFCTERLENAEKRLQMVTRDSSGQVAGLAAVREDEEIAPSTPPGGSATEEDAGSDGEPPHPARLF